MRLHHPSDLLVIPSAPSSGMRWPAWYLRMALAWTDRCIADLQGQLAAEFALEGLAPLYAELEALTRERESLLRRLAPRARR